MTHSLTCLAVVRAQMAVFAEVSNADRFRRDRIEDVAETAILYADGDLVEIGAHVGLTTIRLLRLAKKYDRRVMVVDPWEPGVQQCGQDTLRKFTKRTAKLSYYLDVIRASSQDENVIRKLNGRTISFALVDGLHTYEAALSDICAVSHAGIICVDDIDRFPGVRKAYDHMADRMLREQVDNVEGGMREGYLV